MADWNVNHIEGSQDGWAVTLHYDAVLTDGDDSVRNYGTVSMPAKDGDSTFTDLVAMGEEKAKAYAVHWVKEQLGEDAVASVEAGLVSRMADKKNPPVVNLFPQAEAAE